MLNIRRFPVNKLLIPEVLGGNIIIPVSLQRVYKIKQMSPALPMFLHHLLHLEWEKGGGEINCIDLLHKTIYHSYK